jgi:DNA-binding MarR family transcriptional regulator
MRISLPTYIAGTTQTMAYRLLRHEVYATLAVYDINPTQWSMLGAIVTARDGIRQVDIANILQVKAPLITTMSQTFQDRGLIQSVQNQFDARAKLLAATNEGKKFAKEVEADVNDTLSNLLHGLTEDDMVIYQKVLTTIIANAQVHKTKQ